MATFPISEHQIEQKHKCRVDLGSLLSFEYQQSPFLTPHLSAAPLPTLALRTLMGKLSSKCQMQFYWGIFYVCYELCEFVPNPAIEPDASQQL